MGRAIPVHRHVLTSQCLLFQAQAASGMRDAASEMFVLPSNFSEEAATLFVNALYGELGGGDFDPPPVAPHAFAAASELLCLAAYAGCPSLMDTCGAALALALNDANAARILQLAHDVGAPALKAAALEHVVAHHPAVSATSAYASLDRSLVAEVAERGCHALRRVLQLLRAASDGPDNDHGVIIRPRPRSPSHV